MLFFFLPINKSQDKHQSVEWPRSFARATLVIHTSHLGTTHVAPRSCDKFNAISHHYSEDILLKSMPVIYRSTDINEAAIQEPEELKMWMRHHSIDTQQGADRADHKYCSCCSEDIAYTYQRWYKSAEHKTDGAQQRRCRSRIGTFAIHSQRRRWGERHAHHKQEQ